VKRTLIALAVMIGLFSLLGSPGQPIGSPEFVSSATDSATFPGNRKSHTYYLRGLSHYHSGERAEALKSFEKAQSYDPESAMIAYQIGKTQLELGEFGKAFESLNKAGEFGKGNFEIQRYVAQVYLSLGQFSRAAPYLENAIELNPKWSDGYRMLAGIYRQEGDTLAAARTLERLLEQFPADLFMHLNVAQFYVEADRAEEAVLHLESVKELAVDDPELFLFIASVYAKAGSYDDAIDNYRLHLLEYPEAERALIPLVAAYKKAGRLSDAIAYFSGRVAEDPASVSLRLLLGEVYALDGQEERGLEVWKQAIKDIPESDPDRVSKALRLHYRLASYYEEKEDYEAAIATLEQAAGYPPDETSDVLAINFQLGILHRLVGNYEESSTSFIKILEAVESLDEGGRTAANEIAKNSRYNLAANYDLMGKDEQAEEELKKTLEKDPDFSEASNYLAYFYAVRGRNLDKALELVKRALEKEHSNAAFIDTLGWVYYKLGRYEEALEKLLEADSAIEDPVIADHLGDTFEALGQTDKAAEAWRRSLELAAQELEEDGSHGMDPSYQSKEVKRKLEEAMQGSSDLAGDE